MWPHTASHDALPPLLFANGELPAALRAQGAKASEAAQEIEPDRVLNLPTEDLLAELYEQFRVNPVILDAAAITTPGASDLPLQVQGSGRMITVPGSVIELRVPFAGDADLLKMKASTWNMNSPRGEVRGNVVVLREFGRSPLDPQKVKAAFDETLSAIRQHLEWQLKDIEPFNAQLESELRRAIATRREKVLADRGLEAFLEVPISDRPNPVTTFKVDPPRRDPPRRSETATPFEPEPGLSESGFAAILDEIRAVTTAVERLPKTFAEMPEESLRDVLLVVLNNRFGPATGETFSRAGKTDIFIPVGGGQKAVFIAECKKWRGPASLRKGIDQLLGYLGWRDTKAALVLFARIDEATSVEAKAVAAFEAHPLFKRRANDAHDLPVFIMEHDKDASRELTVALVFVPIIL